MTQLLIKCAITTLVASAAIIVVIDLLAFWDDRNGRANVAMTFAVTIILLWFLTGLGELWR